MRPSKRIAQVAQHPATTSRKEFSIFPYIAEIVADLNYVLLFVCLLCSCFHADGFEPVSFPLKPCQVSPIDPVPTAIHECSACGTPGKWIWASNGLSTQSPDHPSAVTCFTLS